MAPRHMVNVTKIMVAMPVMPPPNGSMNWLIMMMTKAHSLPLTNCIPMPTLMPSMPSMWSLTATEAGSKRNMATTMAPRKAMPIQWSTVMAVAESLTASTSRPTVSSTVTNPMTMPAMSFTLALGPNMPL